MKKTYFAPEFELTEIELNNVLLAGSGGGISDDYSSEKNDKPVTDPNDAFGW